ncbi:MAG TPA: hypothetical protein PLX85_06955 [Dehalococcoidia bacterium]|nr:hypothetical protein [Dehalococcoidia bacterium]
MNEPETAPVKRETQFADSNDGAEIPSPDAAPLYARQDDADHPETPAELHVAPVLPAEPGAATEGLLRGIEEGGLLSYALAERFGALEHCDRCGRPIIEVPTLATALATHYSVGDEERLAFEDAIRRSSLEQANESSPNFCSYHGQITSE